MEAEPPGPPPPASTPTGTSRSPRPGRRPTGLRLRLNRGRATAIAGAVAVALLIGLGYLTSAPGPARGADPRTPNLTSRQPARPDRTAVDAVLAGRARAVRDHDRTAFLATVASAGPAFQAEQAQFFDNLTALPLAAWRQQLETPDPVAAGPGGATLRVTLRYRLRGFDQGEVTRTQYLGFALRSGVGWVIVGDGTAQGLRDDPEVWDGGRLTVVRGRHSLVIGVIGDHAADTGNATQDTLRGIARRLDAAVPTVTGIVGTDWDRSAVALVPADQRQAADLIGGGQDLDRIAALATTTQGTTTQSVTGNAPAGRRGGEDRIVISPGTFAKLTALGRDVVLTHELTHVATGGARDGRTPMWLIEGLADYAGYKNARVSVRSAARELRREVTGGRLPGRLPDRDDFGAGSDRLAQTYEEAWLACRMVAERYGEADLVRLYRAAGAQPEAAFRRVLGIDERAFTAMWRAYLREELG